MQYSFSEWKYQLEKRADSFFQKNLKTGKERRVIRKVSNIVAQYDSVNVPNFSSFAPITRYRFELKGRKNSLD